MVEKHTPSVGFITRKSLFCLFTITPILFIFSWLSVLRSTSHNRFIDHNLLPNSKLLTLNENDHSIPMSQNNAEPSGGSREILMDSNVGEEATIGKEEATAQKEEATARKEEATTQKEELTAQKKDDCRSKMSVKAPLKVYMYDMDPEFHFGLLDWKPKGNNVWPDIRIEIPSYPGGLNLQHSIEYWLTLDLLASGLPNPPNAPAVIRVHNSSEADVIFVPFFSSLSYNRFSKVNPHEKKSRNNMLQDKLVKFVTAQTEWKRSGGRDHIILAHHPNSMLSARMKLWPAMFILADFGRYPPNIAHVDKDVIAPYKHVIRSYVNDSSAFDSRQILLYFQGAIYRKDGGIIRQELFYLLRNEKDVHFTFGSVKKDGIHKASHGMHSSKFCLNIAGDTPSSNRLFDAIASHCVPVIISDEIELPYEDVLDYSEFCIFVRTSDALKEKFLINLIRSIRKDEWTRMWQRLKEVESFYEFQYPSKPGDAVQMIWQAVARKVPAIKRKVHRSRRFSHFIPHPTRGLQSIPSPRSFW